jgi:glycosyltransferase involved in cell wall biosynthesis
MKKVLILAYDFPPNTSVGGQRPYSWLKHFHEFGLYPIVITRHWDVGLKTPEDMLKSSSCETISDTSTEQGRIIQVPYKSTLRDRLVIKQGKNHFSIIRKFISFTIYLGQYFSLKLDPSADIYREAVKLLKKESVDLIIATGKPFVVFRYAYLLNKRFNVPWIADYRDGWADSYTRNNDSLFYRLLNAVELFIEKKFTKNILFLTTVTPFLSVKIAETISKKGYLIPNGVDTSLYDCEIKQNSFFTVCYTGILYNFSYITIFEKAFKAFIEQYPEKDKQFIFVGIELQKNQAYDTIYKLCVEYPDYIKINTRVSASESAVLHQQAHVLLNFIPRNQSMVMPVKTFGYAASKRPTVVVETTPNDGVCFMPNRDIQYFAHNADDMLSLFTRFYLEYKKDKEIVTSITQAEINSFSRKERSRQLSEIIKKYLS